MNALWRAREGERERLQNTVEEDRGAGWKQMHDFARLITHLSPAARRDTNQARFRIKTYRGNLWEESQSASSIDTGISDRGALQGKGLIKGWGMPRYFGYFRRCFRRCEDECAFLPGGIGAFAINRHNYNYKWYFTVSKFCQVTLTYTHFVYNHVDCWLWKNLLRRFVGKTVIFGGGLWTHFSNGFFR